MPTVASMVALGPWLAPWTGWVDHGFYSLHPTLFYDLAHANNYQIEMVAAFGIYNNRRFRFYGREDIGRANAKGDLIGNLNLFVVLRKVFDVPFRIPTQGVYTDFVSEEVKQAWCKQR